MANDITGRRLLLLHVDRYARALIIRIHHVDHVSASHRFPEELIGRRGSRDLHAVHEPGHVRANRVRDGSETDPVFLMGGNDKMVQVVRIGDPGRIYGTRRLHQSPRKRDRRRSRAVAGEVPASPALVQAYARLASY